MYLIGSLQINMGEKKVDFYESGLSNAIYISEAIDEQGQVDVIYTDIEKAFDRVDHRILIDRFDSFGFSLPLLSLFESYLSDRVQFVVYNGYKSNNFLATSGVPQGSNMGPLLFLMFVDGLCSVIDCEHLLFADDMKLFAKISTLSKCNNI